MSNEANERHIADDPSLWWKQAVVYQVYPRSFKDTTGSGLGDIAGVAQQIPYLKRLGVDAIWLSPFYPSQLADGGYDVDDYRNVDPKLGTMDDFDHLTKTAHAAGIKIVVDIVPNHSSNQHEWFKPRLPQAPAHRSETVIFSVTAKDRTATSHPPTGLPASVDPLGLECPTDNGICTCLPSNSPIGIGRIRTCAPISSRPCTSGSTMERTASAWMWRTAWLRISTVTISMISKSSEARCIAPTARIRCMTGTKCTTSIANGARCSTSMIRRHSPSPKLGTSGASIPVCLARRTRPSVQLRIRQERLDSQRHAPRHRRRHRRCGTLRLHLHMGNEQPRHPPPRQPLWAAAGAGCSPPPTCQGLAAAQRYLLP